MNDLTFFLGANSYRGFYSLYEEYMRSYDTARVWILKGGAGCGKSGFLRRVGQRAASAGYTVHRILCSGDPASLDGIHIPELEVMLFDGTAPHVLEPPLVGDRGFYLDLSRFFLPGVPDLREPTEAYREHYRRAYRWLAAAGNAAGAVTLRRETGDNIRKKARSLIARELRKRGREPGTARRFFVDAFTGEGSMALSETWRALTSRTIGLQGVCGAESLFLAAAGEAAMERGWNVILCPDPLQPDRTARLLIPEQGLGIGIGPGDRRIHLDRLVYNAVDKEESAHIRDTEAMRLALLNKAKKELRLAKQHHDRLEAAVNPHVDFAGVYDFAERFASELLSQASSPAGQ